MLNVLSSLQKLPYNVIFFFCGWMCMQTAFSQEQQFKYYNPAQDPALVITGQAWPDEVQDYYDRLPARSEKLVRKPVWNLSKNSAGLQLQFISDATEIVVKYTVAGNLQMPHMPATGVSGVDLYAQDQKENWLWAAAKFSFGDTIVYRYANLSPGKRTYTLYLPLYNSVKWMEIGVPAESDFIPLPASQSKPVVIYGTSIAQGACASRPGMAWTNILSRRIHHPVTNLAFSGNGRMEKELVELIAEIDASLYVIDCLPNMTAGYISTPELKTRITSTVELLRSKRPFTPILFTEHDGYTDGNINQQRKKAYTDVNLALDEVMDSLKQVGYKNIFLLKKEAIGQDISSMVDGTHPNDLGMMNYANAYEKKLNEIFKATGNINTEVPAIIPLPRQLKWKDGVFALAQYKNIFASAALKEESAYLHEALKSLGIMLPVTSPDKNTGKAIELRLDNTVSLPSPEGYLLKIDYHKILLTANTPHGIFNSIQTLLQIISKDNKITACEIKDWPAYSWRGYMIDVGRNYMPVNLLKQQIDAMARYKLNIFHFHPTEDIAWRFAIKQYPQLTAAEAMTRDKGKFYSEKEIKELIQYCKQRHIIFVPEIDMPGHSAAFRRAMGVDMQSDSGLKIVKNILKEICTKYDVPYIHIGADEVKIHNQDFVPEVTKWIEQFGKRVIGWQPGGNFSKNTIRQLWMDDAGRKLAGTDIQYIDSRHLYLNHMDPLEAVVTIFNREIGDKKEGDSLLPGGTLCMWNDRRAADPEDILRMNPVYPGMIAFAERTWRGGGSPGWISNISDGDIHDFRAFENRLLKHKKKYFEGMPFPYRQQSQMHWNLYGTYDNGGDLQKRFPPELSGDYATWKFYNKQSGGTVVLRHWWYPLIKGAISDAKENSTVYALTHLWSNTAEVKDFWIGFNNLSRSPATDSPPEGGWDYKGSEVWVNGKIVAPPQWKHAGAKGNSEVPLVDEGYEYRPPAKIFLNKGWNTVLLKCPVGSFKGSDWQNPVKWEFTFLPIDGKR